MANLETIRTLLAEQLDLMLGAELSLHESETRLAARSTDSLVCEVFKKNARDRLSRLDALKQKVRTPLVCAVTAALIEAGHETARYDDTAMRDLALIFILRRIQTHALICCENAQMLAAALGETALESELGVFSEQRRATLERLNNAVDAITPQIV